MNIKKVLYPLTLLGLLFASALPLHATVIVDSPVLNIDGSTNIFRDFRGDSSTRTSGDRLVMSVKVSDVNTPGLPPSGDTSVVVKQIADSSDPNSETGFSRNVNPFFGPAIPNEFGTSTAWNDSFAGSAWKIEATNPPGNDANKEVRVTANNTIPAGDHLPLATDINLDGNGNLSWTIPPTAVEYNQFRVVVIRESDRRQVVNGDRTSIPYNANGQDISLNIFTDPAFAGNLDENEEYELRIETTFFDGARNISRQINRSSTFVNFTLLPEATGPLFLPTLDPNGVFNFDFEVVEGETFSIDPLIAIGYEYAIGAGDPLFASVLIPDDLTASGAYSLFLNGIEHSLLPGELFNFLSIDSNGIGNFSILGIDPLLQLDPTDTTAFITDLTFAGSGRFTGSMTPITVDVPSPPTLLLMLSGLIVAGFARSRSRIDRNTIERSWRNSFG